MLKPFIGITAYSQDHPSYGWRYDVCYGHYAQAIEKAGGMPVLIPTRLQDDTLRGIYERLDAVLLPGGGDINPDTYKATLRHETLAEIDDNRDRMEISLTRWAADDDRPVLGICRGIQMMNVALGGTLIQDIPSTVVNALQHDIPRNTPRSTLLHEVQIDASSRLGRILGKPQLAVNSIHHQAVETLAPGMVITAHAPDGVVEAIEWPEKHFFLAVQWHPEDLVGSESDMMPLFEAFVTAARERLSTKIS